MNHITNINELYGVIAQSAGFPATTKAVQIVTVLGESIDTYTVSGEFAFIDQSINNGYGPDLLLLAESKTLKEYYGDDIVPSGASGLINICIADIKAIAINGTFYTLGVKR